MIDKKRSNIFKMIDFKNFLNNIHVYNFIILCVLAILIIYHFILNKSNMENKVDTTVDTHVCTWKLGDDISKSPHIHEPFRPIPKKIYDDVLDAIGNTPMVRLNKVPQNNGIQC